MFCVGGIVEDKLPLAIFGVNAIRQVIDDRSQQVPLLRQRLVYFTGFRAFQKSFVAATEQRPDRHSPCEETEQQQYGADDCADWSFDLLQQPPTGPAERPRCQRNCREEFRWEVAVYPWIFGSR